MFELYISDVQRPGPQSMSYPMALKRLLIRIFNNFKFRKSGPHPTQDVAPVPEVFSRMPSLNVTQAVAPLPERSPATETTIPPNITLQLNLVLSPTGDGWHPCVSLRQGQACVTPGICEGTTSKGPTPPLSHSSVGFKIDTTAVQPAKIINTVPSSAQGLSPSGLGIITPQDESFATCPAPECAPPARSQSIAVTPYLTRTMQTLESKNIETPEQHTGARTPIRIAGSSVKQPIGILPTTPGISDESSPQKVNLVLQQSQLYDFPSLESQLDEPPSALCMDNGPPLYLRTPSLSVNGNLHPGYPTRQDPQNPQCPPGLGSPYKPQQQNFKKNDDNGLPPRPPRGETLTFLAHMSPTFEPTPFNLPLQNHPLNLGVNRATGIEIDRGAVTVQRISNNGNTAYSIKAGGHKYLATAQVGSGGFGYVWYAIKDGKEEVAIKVVDKAGLLAQFVFCAKDKHPTAQQLLEGSRLAAEVVDAEYEAFKRISEDRSPFLTPLLHAFEDKNNFYFVMRFYPQTLRTRARFGFMHWQLRLVAAELLVALQHLHKLRIVHLDLKMENILVTPSGHVCIADFGNARVLDRKLNYQEFHAYRIYGTSGTEGYFPPERVEGHKGYNFKTDTWTYAVILLELFLINGGHWYSIYHNDDGTPKFGDNCKLPAGYNENHSLAFMTPREEINLVHDAHARDLLLSIFAPQHHTMRPEWEALRCHPFFASINWKKLENRGYDPMFKACFGNALLQPVDSGRRAIKRSHPQLQVFKRVVLEQEKYDVALGRVHVDYMLPAQVADDTVHGTTCMAPGSKLLPRQVQVCDCDLPADWHRI